MGGSKPKQKPAKKVAQSVPTKFDCPFCNHSGTCECKLNYNNNQGTIKCRICGANYSMEINHLTEPIDIYSEWIDATEEVNKPDSQLIDNTQYNNDNDDSDNDNDNDTQQKTTSSARRAKQRHQQRKAASGYDKSDDFIASEDDQDDEEELELDD